MSMYITIVLIYYSRCWRWLERVLEMAVIGIGAIPIATEVIAQLRLEFGMIAGSPKLVGAVGKLAEFPG